MFTLFTDLYLCFQAYEGLLLQTKYQYKGTRVKLIIMICAL